MILVLTYLIGTQQQPVNSTFRPNTFNFLQQMHLVIISLGREGSAPVSSHNPTKSSMINTPSSKYPIVIYARAHTQTMGGLQWVIICLSNLMFCFRMFPRSPGIHNQCGVLGHQTMPPRTLHRITVPCTLVTGHRDKNCSLIWSQDPHLPQMISTNNPILTRNSDTTLQLNH